MTKKTKDVLLRSDRVLVIALAVILAAASAAVGAAATNHPRTEQMAAVAVTQVAAPVQVAPRGFVVPAAMKPASSADMAMAQLLEEHRCLSEVMYYEARGEGTDGQMAVAEVVFHRLRHGHYGHSICAVVYEGAGGSSAGGCQFSFACHTDQLAHKTA